MLINGYKDWQEAYDQSKEDLKLLDVCSKSEELVQQLSSNLDASPRASSETSNINGQLKRLSK